LGKHNQECFTSGIIEGGDVTAGDESDLDMPLLGEWEAG